MIQIKSGPSGKTAELFVLTACVSSEQNPCPLYPSWGQDLFSWRDTLLYRVGTRRWQPLVLSACPHPPVQNLHPVS